MTNILILGGTGWLSGEVARQAVAAGHAVTCLARGSGDWPAGVERVVADRTAPEAYAAVADRTWDVVVDVTRQPGQVRGAVAALAPALGAAGHWVFVSTGSVYLPDVTRLAGTESDPVRDPLDGDVADLPTYGEGKVACERALLDAFDADRVTIARAGLIGGPGDTSDRFGYYPAAYARAAADGAGPVLVPRADHLSVQLIDVRDLAAWLLHAGNGRVGGVFDLVGEPTTLGAVLDMAAAAAGYTGRTVRVDPEALRGAGVQYWAGERSLTLWLPDDHELTVPRAAAAAVAAGLQRRPIKDTITDVLADERAAGLERARSAGLTRDEELALIGELADD